ncbi:MAG: sigma-70 family RNA polymerase sigma factor [Myxococcales bacterium]|nr:sigma-70 family RNA polymerase sigma factor [Myxococcales bacterium]
MQDDAELLAAWRAGDASAGQKLFGRYFEPVSRFFINKLPHDHEDLIQETFTACVRGRDRLRKDSSFRSYLFSTAYNVLKSYFSRNRGPRATEPLESCATGDLAPGPSTLLRASERDRLLLEALRSIPLELQVVLEMRFWEGMSSEEIGEVLGISPTTVRTRTFRGREKLGAILARLVVHGGDKAAPVDDLEGWAARVRALMAEPGA